jgi:hypothetical protein
MVMIQCPVVLPEVRSWLHSGKARREPGTRRQLKDSELSESWHGHNFGYRIRTVSDTKVTVVHAHRHLYSYDTYVGLSLNDGLLVNWT